MKPITKLIVFPFICLLIGLGACKPRKAIALKEAITQKERFAFNILVGDSSAEVQKLHCLIKSDYPGALAALDREEKDFNKLIDEIKSLPATDIKQGEELKTAAVDYYTELKTLQLFDRNEIKQRQLSVPLKGEELDAAQKKILELSIQKQGMYKKVYQRDSVLQQALKIFSTTHGI